MSCARLWSLFWRDCNQNCAKITHRKIHCRPLNSLGLIVKTVINVMERRKLARTTPRIRQRQRIFSIDDELELIVESITACSYQHGETCVYTPHYRGSQLEPKHPLEQTKQYRYYQLFLTEFWVCLSPESEPLLHTSTAFIFAINGWKACLGLKIHSDRERCGLSRMWRLSGLFRTTSSAVRAR